MLCRRLPLDPDMGTKYVVMPFVVTNASTVFMDYMNIIFRPFLHKFV